jgi:hypothetical protein
VLLSFGNRFTPYIVASFAFRGIVCALISSICSSIRDRLLIMGGGGGGKGAASTIFS